MLSSTYHFLRHWWTAQSRYAVHSPFVYTFVTELLPNRKSPAGTRIDALRESLSHSEERLEIRDFGAGYGGDARPVIHKDVREVVRGSARRRAQGEFLARLTAAYRPERILELGTNLGFSAAYLLSGHPESHLYSLEGAPSLARTAKINLEALGYRADIRVGEFGETLPSVLSEGKKLDFVLLDGNHQYAPTVKYFGQIAPQVRDGGLIIVDDINWSAGMRKAWQELRAREEVSVSVDLFWMGLCFLRRNQSKQHFRFRMPY